MNKVRMYTTHQHACQPMPALRAGKPWPAHLLQDSMHGGVGLFEGGRVADASLLHKGVTHCEVALLI